MTTDQPYSPPPSRQPYNGYAGPMPTSQPPRPRGWFRRHPIWTALIVLFLIGLIGSAFGVGGNSSDKAAVRSVPSAPSASAPAVVQAPSATALAKRAGCTHVGPWDAPEPPLYVAQIVTCRDPAWTLKNGSPDGDAYVDFRTFNNNAARDAWLQQAVILGDHGVIKGDRWVIDIPDALLPVMRVADEIANKAGGEIVL